MSVVRLEADEDVIDKIVYCLANPVTAGLVAHGERVSSLVAERKAAVRDEHARSGVRFLGVVGVRRQKQTDRPDTIEPRRKLSPQIAAKDRRRRLATIERLKAFQEVYRTALEQWRQGGRDVLLSVGTYAMRVVHGAACVAMAP